jgi:uncharacterized phiE125 gp8 family phage protein
MGLRRESVSDVEIITLDSVKDHLRITDPFDNPALSAFITAAIDYVERETGTQLPLASFTLTLDGFPRSREIRLPKPPLRSVSTVSFVDPSGEWQSVGANQFRVDDTTPGRIILPAGDTWPATDGSPGCVEISFDAGYGEDDPVPQTLLQCIRLLVGHWYENREGATDRRIDTVPMAVESLIQMHKFTEAV